MSEGKKVIAEQREVMGEQRDVMNEQKDIPATSTVKLVETTSKKTHNVNRVLAVAVIILSALSFTLGFVAYNAVNIAGVVEYERQVNRYLLCKLLFIQGVKKDRVCIQSGFDFEGKPIW